MHGRNVKIRVNNLVLIILLMTVTCCSERSGNVPGQPGGGADRNAKVVKADASKTGSSDILEIILQQEAGDPIFVVNSKNIILSDGQLEWTVSGIPVSGATGIQFQAMGVKKGDVIQASAMLSGKRIFSNSIEIRNRMPEITSGRFMPEMFRQGDVLYIDVAAEDDDGDPISYKYEWTCNGQPAGQDKKISVPVKRGDEVSVSVTPFDGEEYGKPAVFQRAILNMPPVILGYGEVSFDGRIYSCQVKASDPDNDALTYTIQTAAEGMTINDNTGLIQWNAPNGFKGSVPVTVTVSDGHGGSTSAETKITIK